MYPVSRVHGVLQFLMKHVLGSAFMHGQITVPLKFVASLRMNVHCCVTHLGEQEFPSSCFLSILFLPFTNLIIIP